MRTIEIKNINGVVLFSHTAENNTVKLTVEEAVKNDINLALADLGGVNLAGANLIGAILRGASFRGANLRDTNLEKADLNEADLAEANLNCAYLKRATLIGANLKSACLDRAILLRADFGMADLSGADLSGADLTDTNLEDTGLAGACLKGAVLFGANLSGAKLYGADLEGSFITGANLNWAGLNGAKNIPYIPLSCPSEGAFVAWKKVRGKYLVKLQIPEDARRSSATTRKCRCDKALVLEITSLDGNKHYDEVTNNNYKETVYKVGEFVYPDSFDENRWNECSNGIHFFINKEEAINY